MVENRDIRKARARVTACKHFHTLLQTMLWSTCYTAFALLFWQRLGQPLQELGLGEGLKGQGSWQPGTWYHQLPAMPRSQPGYQISVKPSIALGGIGAGPCIIRYALLIYGYLFFVLLKAL